MIEVTNLRKTYGDKIAVNGISFSVNCGEIVGFLGSNGAGKSTTMNILTGYLSASDGTVRVDGKDILECGDRARSKIGYLPEIPPVYPDLTVNEYLNFVFELKKCRLNRKKHLDEVCEVVRISDVRNRLIKNLSKGYRQRIGLAQALIGNPSVIILDEPTVGLDPKQIIEIRNLIRMLGRDHAVIMSSHILSEVQAVCDRVIVLDRGNLIADRKTEDLASESNGTKRITVKVCGPSKEILSAIRSIVGVTYVQTMPEHDADSTTFSVETQGNADIRKPLFREMAKNNWEIIGMETSGINLEDAFLSLLSSGEAKTKKRRVVVKVNDSKKGDE